MVHATDDATRADRRAHGPSCDERCRVCGLSPRIKNARRGSRLVAESASLQAVLKRAALFATADAPVVIFGESGTGKEVVARALHDSGPRAAGPFVAVNVAALPAELLESELFGHARGAFTGAATATLGLFEAANGGSLFLDEIGELPMALQAKLLRALQDGEVRRVGDTRARAVDARIVCATHRDLADRVREGLFREDLYYRLKVLTLRVPSLRDRREDILPLAHRFLADEGCTGAGFTRAAEQALSAYGWPGNVRELMNAVKHGVALARGGAIDLAHLPEELSAAAKPAGRKPAASLVARPSAGVLRPLAEVEREHVLRVLEACGGSQVEASRVLGIGRNTLWRKLRQYA
jgi:two-component system response regulator HydG